MLQKLCYFIFFKCLGWRMIGQKPNVDKYIFVAAPHTSNWDFIYGWLAINSLGLNVKIFAKDNYYRWPIRWACDLLGVMPVNRQGNTNFVDAVVWYFNQYDKLGILITPEGTRSLSKGLKSGYYHIAKKANAWIIVSGPNFKDKTFTLNAPRRPLTSFAEDEADVIAFCKMQVGKNPASTFQ